MAIFWGKLEVIEAGLATHRPVAINVIAKGMDEEVEVITLAKRVSVPDPVLGPQLQPPMDAWNILGEKIEAEWAGIGAHNDSRKLEDGCEARWARLWGGWMKLAEKEMGPMFGGCDFVHKDCEVKRVPIRKA